MNTLSETEALQNLGAAIFAFLLNNMTMTPQGDNILFCTQSPDGESSYCSEIPKRNICGIPASVPKNNYDVPTDELLYKIRF